MAFKYKSVRSTKQATHKHLHYTIALEARSSKLDISSHVPLNSPLRCSVAISDCCVFAEELDRPLFVLAKWRKGRIEKPVPRYTQGHIYRTLVQLYYPFLQFDLQFVRSETRQSINIMWSGHRTVRSAKPADEII